MMKFEANGVGGGGNGDVEVDYGGVMAGDTHAVFVVSGGSSRRDDGGVFLLIFGARS